MLVTFRSEAFADITMFGDVAVTLLKLMGHSGSVPGAILAEDVPMALKRLTVALDAGKESAPEQGADAGSDDDEPPVSLANRAFPLVELLEASVKARCNVMWGP
jgi:hypothetical protein